LRDISVSATRADYTLCNVHDIVWLLLMLAYHRCDVTDTTISERSRLLWWKLAEVS